MKLRKLSRRSFLTQVAGGAVAGAGAIILGAGEAGAVVQTDSDTGRNADPAGGGRGGVTDSDSGRNADPVGGGRGGRSNAVTDSDTGRNADPIGRGRGGNGGNGGGGVTD